MHRLAIFATLSLNESLRANAVGRKTKNEKKNIFLNVMKLGVGWNTAGYDE